MPAERGRTALAQLLRGVAMGSVELVPGVSSGTVALVLGIYERLVHAISTAASALRSGSPCHCVGSPTPSPKK